MVIQARSRGICQSCRNDLQLIFERGFCSTTTVSKTRPIHLSHPRKYQVSTRAFSVKARRFTPASSNPTESSKPVDQHELSNEDTALKAQAAIIEQLEKELGKPLEQAIQEDEVSAELLDKYQRAIDSLQNPEDEFDPVADVRDAGASTAEIVRTARQLYGDILPDGKLKDEELTFYKRLYGEPAKGVLEEEVREDPILEQDPAAPNQLFSAKGEEIEFRPYSESLENNSQQNDILSTSRTDIALAKARDLAASVGGNVMEEDDYDDPEEDDEEFSENERGHPLTMMGKFRTNPKTVFLSQDGFVRPVEKIMSNYSNKHLKEMCERTFGGPGLPDSPLTPRSARARQQIPIPLDAGQNTMGGMEANAFISAVMPPTYASIMSVLVETRKRLGPTWLTNLLAREGGPRVLDAGAGGAGVIAWREIIRAHWDTLHSSDTAKPSPPSTKSVVLTGSDGLRHRAAEMLENTTFIPRLPDYVHTRDTPTLEDDRPTQQRKKFDVIIASHTLFGYKEDWMRKQYVQNLWTMLSDQGGVLILVEKGVPRGFEAIAGAREMLLDRYIAVPDGYSTHYSQSHTQQLDDEGIHKKETAMIVAPCTNHDRCPMYAAPGLSRGRKDICSFQQRYIRPAFLQRILGAKDRNHDDVDFSYLSVMKGDDLRTRSTTTWDHLSDPLSAPRHSNTAELGAAHKTLMDEFEDGFEHFVPPIEQEADATKIEPLTKDQLPMFNHMPRIVYPPIKRRGHVSIDLCTPTARIERWTIPRSFSKQAYRDARKSKWGDLWALGAKTRIVRNLKVGTPEKDLIGKDGEIIKGKGRGRKERLKIKAMQMLEKREEEKMDDLMEQRDLMAALDEELETGAGISRAVHSDAEPMPLKKPMNNRERKAAKRALKEEARNPTGSSQPIPVFSTSNDADLTFKPPPKQRSQSTMDDIAVEHAMSEWQAEFEREAMQDRSQKRSGFGSKGSTNKAAKVMQRETNRNKKMSGRNDF